MPEILITGSSGFLGKNLYSYLCDIHDVIGVSRSDSKTTDIKMEISSNNIPPKLMKIHPDIIVHCAALVNADYCEEHKEEAFNANVKSTLNIVKYAIEKNAKMIYISSDYVYDGLYGGYTEQSTPNPINYYGITKVISEK